VREAAVREELQAADFYIGSLSPPAFRLGPPAGQCGKRCTPGV